MIREYNRAGNTVLIIEEIETKGWRFYLYSFFANGFEGDTLHETLEEAKHQADYEFAPLNGPWLLIPADVADLREFARKISE